MIFGATWKHICYKRGRDGTKSQNIPLCASVPPRSKKDSKSVHTNSTVTSRAPCAPITSACSMSAVLEGPEMKTP